MALVIIAVRRKDKQHVKRWQRVNGLWGGLVNTETQMWPSPKFRAVLAWNNGLNDVISSFPAAWILSSIAPPLSSKESHWFAKKYHTSSVCWSVITTCWRNHAGLDPELSCQIRISVSLPKDDVTLSVKLFTLPREKYFLLANGSFNEISPLLPWFPFIIIPTFEDVPKPFHMPVCMLTWYM